ncbi:reverse transcriptase [Senna tora]|uniref:Reverse transcriptase n=1 Tax=Senna tora TaxID=362788 RepID=A0A834WAI6_9FABA|nr:reverse transcriptase [Senna tora]
MGVGEGWVQGGGLGKRGEEEEWKSGGVMGWRGYGGVAMEDGMWKTEGKRGKDGVAAAGLGGRGAHGYGGLKVGEEEWRGLGWRKGLGEGMKRMEKRRKGRGDCIDICGLTDLGYSRPKFTWCNKRPNGQLVFERLDRFMGNGAWLNLCPHTVNFHLPKIKSDHNPMLLCTQPSIFNRSARPFRCERIWINHPDFLNVVQDGWDSAHNLSNALTLLKGKAISWNKHSLGNIFERKKILMKRLNGVGHALNYSPSPQLAILEQNLSKQYRDILLMEEELWASKARLD